jgi:lysophospholipase L1-like esterase
MSPHTCRWTRWTAPALLACALGAGCAGTAGAPAPAATEAERVEPLPDGAGLRVLFLGNSLTAGNDLPVVVQALAAAGGVSVRYRARTPPNFSLEDHWQGGASRRLLGEGKWDYVVLQQGPSSRPESQANLREWAAAWGDEARRRGAKPALYMVWPFRGQPDGFGQVSMSYRRAAAAAAARVFPAGEAWQEALRRDPAPRLYQADGLHPTRAGTYLAALVVAHGLTGVRPKGAPARLTLASGAAFALPEAEAEALRQAAEKVVAPEG